MRKLKFRLYLKDYKKYGGTYEPENWGYMMGAYDLSNDNYILEQCTGLIDKNGVEIYEGDIVNIDMNFYHIEAKVEYRDDLGTFVFDYPKGVRTVIVDCIRKEHIEVIGNIHKE